MSLWKSKKPKPTGPNRDSWPDVGERLKATVTDLYPSSCAVVLDEYPSKRAFIGLNEISAKWGRSLHVSDHVQIGQRIETKVIDVDMQKGYISCSLRAIEMEMAWQPTETKVAVGSTITRLCPECGSKLNNSGEACPCSRATVK